MFGCFPHCIHSQSQEMRSKMGVDRVDQLLKVGREQGYELDLQYLQEPPQTFLLTDLQKSVLDLLPAHSSEIAEKLGYSIQHVRSQLWLAKRTLGARTRAELYIMWEKLCERNHEKS